MMRNKLVLTLLAAALLVGITACSTRTDETDTGGVILLVSDFDGLPAFVSVNCRTGEVAIEFCDEATFGTFSLSIGEITLENIVADPTGTSSRLMDVEIDRMQIGFRRIDQGTRVPPTLFRNHFSLVPVNGTATLENLPILTSEGFVNPPLNDLRLLFGGVDSETGSETILLEFELVFFGRTLSGDEVQTSPFNFTVEFRP